MKRRLLAVAKKEIIQITRDWRSLTVAVLLPVLLLILYGFGINLDVKHLRTAVLDQDMTRQSRELLDSFQHSGYFDFHIYMDSYSQLGEILDSGRAKVAIVVPEGFADDIMAGRADVQLIVDGSDATTSSLAISYGSQIAGDYSRKMRLKELRRRGIDPISTTLLDVRTRYWYNPELNSTNFIIPGLIAVILMLLSSLLTSMTIVRERERGTIEQVVVSPIRPHELVLGKLMPYVLLAFIDVLVVIAGARFIFDVPIRGSVLLLLVMSVMFLTAALSLGMLISSLSRSQLVAMTIAILATMLPTVMLSGFIYPINTMPKITQLLTNAIPARYYLVIVRGIFLKGIGLDLLWGQALLLLVTGVLLIGLSARLFRKVL